MTLLEFVRFLRHSALLIVLMTLLGLGASAAYAYVQPVVYQSSATGIVVAGDNTSVGGAMSGSALSQQRAAVYAALAGTGAVRDRAIQSPELQAEPGAAGGTISASIVTGTPLITVYATGGSGEEARMLADAGLQALADEALALEMRTPTEDGTAALPDDVAVRIATYSPATASSTPISPDWVRLLLIGTGLGLGLGLALAFVRSKLDVRVRTMADVEAETGHGVLGVIPDTKELAEARTGARISLSKLGAAGEALRQLRTNLRYVNIDSPPRSIVVTSANPGEGKSTISSTLAVLIARSGQPVVLIDADLRKPVQHQIFGADNAVGLSQVLVGDVSVEDALQQTNEPNLMVLTSGKVPANPSEMVGSRRMKTLLAGLAKHYFVITDAPPILAVTDAGLLTAATDGAVLVARVGKTHKEQLRMATKLLKQVGGSVLGTVLHRAGRRSMGNVVYGAGHGGAYQAYYGTGAATVDDEDGAPISVRREAPRAEPEPEPVPARVVQRSAKRSAGH
ncbi:tyrosine-protein kinase domain-containing protein [Tessaracoccus sp. Z1128]